MIKTFETNAHRISIKGDGIMYVYSKPKHIEEEDMVDLINKLKELGKGEKVLVLMNPTEENSMTDGAKNQVVNHMGEAVVALGVINRKPYIADLGNFFLNSKVRTYAFNMFADESTATYWLLQIQNSEIQPHSLRELDQVISL
ncbi:MAG: hypothetical protein JKY54_01760 [Flavobacteriales bacterium]|nr:hypothetical protein [Flavobacteriales bacterium]